MALLIKNRRSERRRCLIAAQIAVGLCCLQAHVLAGETKYWKAINQELARLDLNALCNESTLSCLISDKDNRDTPRFDILLKYSTKTDTIYFCIEEFYRLKNDTGPSAEMARRLLELNREMVTGKFEWNRGENTIRLSTVLNTDSNFDRRAFRSQLSGLKAVAARLHSELADMAQSQRVDAENSGD